MKSLIIPILLLLLLSPTAFAADSNVLKAGVLSPVMPAPELSLQGTDGKPLTLARFRGKIVLLAFGFSSCSEVCPITLASRSATSGCGSRSSPGSSRRR